MPATRLIFWLMIFYAGRSLSVSAQSPPTPTADQLMQLMQSQPQVDVSSPVTASSSFDPPLVRPGEKAIYRVTFNATVVSVNMPGKIPAPPQLAVHLDTSGQIMQPTGGAFQMFATFDYEVHATEPGQFTIPQFTVPVYGQPVIVPPAQLEVKAELPESHKPVRQLLVVPFSTNVFVGEALNVSVRLPASPEGAVEAVTEMQLNGDSFVVDKNAVRQSIQPIDLNGRNVVMFDYETSITPIVAGKLKLSAQGFTAGMQFSGPVVISGKVSIPGGPPKYLLLNSEPVTINVRPLPTGNELPGFTGAVGSYTLDPPVLETNMIKVGEVAQLTLVIRGQKNLSRLSPPLPPHVQGWQIFPAERAGMVSATAAKYPGASFKYTLVALTDAVHDTPIIPFSYFDPALGSYVDLTIPSVPVTVLPNNALTNGEAALMLSETATESEQNPGLSKLAQTPGWTTGNPVPLQMRGWFLLVQLVPVLSFLGLWHWDRRRRFLERHPEIVRRRQARRALRRELRLLKGADGNYADFIRHAVYALQIASAPHYPAAPRALVCGDILQILTAKERDGKSGETVRRFFAAADAAAFADARPMPDELFAEKSNLMELLSKLEARL